MQIESPVIGIDLDNTIIQYDSVFTSIAHEFGLIPPQVSLTKNKIRDLFRERKNGELEWQKAQAQAYGPRLQEATPISGFRSFLRRANNKHAKLFIVSHKTQFARRSESHLDLRKVALDWLRTHQLIDHADSPLTSCHVYFENDRSTKAARIESLKCQYFIDDLPEFFEEPSFPQSTEKILFSKTSRSIFGIRCTNWSEIENYIFPQDGDYPRPVSLRSQIAITLKDNNLRIARHASGRNSRIYKVDSSNHSYALKEYFSPKTDTRDRQSTEFSSFMFCSRLQIAPKPIHKNTAQNWSLFSWIPGNQILPDDVSESIIDQLVENFFKLLNAPRSKQAFNPASEACFSLNALEQNLLKRIECLSSVKVESENHNELNSFLSYKIKPFMYKSLSEAHSQLIELGQSPSSILPPSERILSPSDFGFHNAILSENGKLTMLDFEYFGWDDPAKTLCDFWLHPSEAMQFSHALKKRFQEKFLETITPLHPTLKERFLLLFPLYGIKWCLILLNEFIQSNLKRRQFARDNYYNKTETEKIQLHKANALLSKICQNYFPIKEA